MTTDGAGWQAWFEHVWEDREERVYRELFGEINDGIYTLSAEIFTQTFQQGTLDPRWLFYGVLESPPSANRASWLYVTSGMSNPWEDDKPNSDQLSGLGCEFVFETTQRGEWAIQRLQELMAYQILLAHGRYEGREVMGYYDRLTLRASIMPGFDSAIRNLVLAPPAGYPDEFQLESGTVVLIAVAGITDVEVQFAREHSSEALLTLLQQANAFPITDPQRHPIL